MAVRILATLAILAALASMVPLMRSSGALAGTPTGCGITDLAVSKTVDHATPDVGDQVVFTITVTNQGGDTGTNISASDVLPSGFIFESSTTAGGSYNQNTGVLTVPILTSGQSATLTLTVLVTGGAVSGVTNTAEVIAADQFDPDSTPNNHNASEDDQASVTVNAQDASLSITKTDLTTSVIASVPDTYTVTVSNAGADTAHNVIVSDIVPTSGAPSLISNGGGYDANTHTITWNLGDIASGSFVTLTYTVVYDGSQSSVTNTATVQSDTFDANLTDNAASDTDTVLNDNAIGQPHVESVSQQDVTVAGVTCTPTPTPSPTPSPTPFIPPTCTPTPAPSVTLGAATSRPTRTPKPTGAQPLSLALTPTPTVTPSVYAEAESVCLNTTPSPTPTASPTTSPPGSGSPTATPTAVPGAPTARPTRTPHH
ncbi:MAG: hypothetical protein ABI559_02225 [Chloroflexota bacterium]